VVLALSLLGLHGSLWYFRPQLEEKISPLSQDSVGNTHGNNRKLLEFNISVESYQRPSTSPREFRHTSTKECSELRHLNSSEQRCQFIKSSNSCEIDHGFIQYIQIPYCSFPRVVSLAFVLLALWLLFLFITLGVAADDYFCPSLKVISKTLNLSQNIAGVTFLACGNGAPDIFSTLAALSQSRNRSGEQLGIQALFGGGMFITTVVLGVVSFISTVTVTSRPFTRDVLFYLGAVAWTFLTLYKENITLTESIGFIVFYVAYILVVIIGHCIYQRWKRKITATERFLESSGYAKTRKLENEETGSTETSPSVTVSEESNDVGEESVDIDEPRTLSDALLPAENTLLVSSLTILQKPASRRNSTTSEERILLLNGRAKISAWRKLLQGLNPVDKEEWRQSNFFCKFFLICKVPAVFFLNLTIPVVNYDQEDHNWNKWLNVLHCVTMPVFGAIATKGGNILIGGGFPVWALALCGGVVLAFIVAMATTSNRRPRAHFLFGYLAFVVSVIWIYTTATEIVNLLQTFGIVFGLSDAILGLTFLAWGNCIGDLVSNPAMARQGFSRMAVSACFGGPLLNMLLGIGISCTVFTISRGHAIPLRHRYHQYVISAGFLAASLSSSAIIIPLVGFKIPRMYGVYLILLYIAYIATSIAAEIKHV